MSEQWRGDGSLLGSNPVSSRRPVEIVIFKYWSLSLGSKLGFGSTLVIGTPHSVFFVICDVISLWSLSGCECDAYIQI